MDSLFACAEGSEPSIRALCNCSIATEIDGAAGRFEAPPPPVRGEPLLHQANQRMKPSSSFFAQAITSLFDCPAWTFANMVGWIARLYICAAMSGGAG